MSARALFVADGLQERQELRQGVEALLAGRLSALEFPQLLGNLDLSEVLALLREALDELLRRDIRPGDVRLQRGFQLRDEFMRLQRAVDNGANPNRQLTIEHCVASLVQVVGA